MFWGKDMHEVDLKSLKKSQTIFSAHQPFMHFFTKQFSLLWGFSIFNHCKNLWIVYFLVWANEQLCTGLGDMVNIHNVFTLIKQKFKRLQKNISLVKATLQFNAWTNIWLMKVKDASAWHFYTAGHMWPWTTKAVLSSLGNIYSNSQKYIVWVKMINFSFMPKIIRILSKDNVPRWYLVNSLP